MFLQNPTHCHSEAWSLDSLGLSGWLHSWKVVRLSDGWFRWRDLTAVTWYFLCPYSEYERQNILNLSCLIPFWFVTSWVRWHRWSSSNTVDKCVISWGSNALDRIIYVFMTCKIDKTYPDLVFPQIHRSIIRQNAFYVSDNVSCMKQYHQEFSVSHCKSFGSDTLPTH